MVDNASTDDSVPTIKALHPSVVVVVLETNRGFVGGVNAGMLEAHRLELSHAWLLNDDTVVDDDVLQKLLSYAARHPQFHLFSPVIRDSHEPHAVQFANGVIDWQRSVAHSDASEELFARLIADGGTAVLIGTALLVDLRVLATVSGFDPRYFAYWEDIDFCVRCAKAGFFSSVVADATVLHDSPPRETRAPYYPYYGIRNEALFWTKYARRGAPSWRPSWLARALLFMAELREAGHTEKVQAATDGVWDALHRREGPWNRTRQAPAWFVRLLSTRPYLLVMLLRGEFGLVLRKLVSKGSR